MNYFREAILNKYRFPSSKGELTAEQLCDLPLQSKSGMDLDSVAKAVAAELSAATQGSFVTNAVQSPLKAALEAKLELVKEIIAIRQSENSAKLVALQRAQERDKLQGLLAKKQDQALESLSAEEIAARLKALEGAA